jgi:hypothetical protein
MRLSIGPALPIRLMDSARHVIAWHSTQYTRLQIVLNDVMSTIHQSLPTQTARGAARRARSRSGIARTAGRAARSAPAPRRRVIENKHSTKIEHESTSG